MKRKIVSVLVLCGALSIWGGLGVAAAACSCQAATGFPGPALTACLVNPPTKVTGAVDATGCDIGVYYSSGHSGSVNDATITGENCFGVLVNGASVNVVNSHIPVSAGTCAAYPDYQFGIVYLNGANCSKGRCNIQGNVITLPVNGKDGVVAKNPGRTWQSQATS